MHLLLLHSFPVSDHYAYIIFVLVFYMLAWYIFLYRSASYSSFAKWYQRKYENIVIDEDPFVEQISQTLLRLGLSIMDGVDGSDSEK